MNTSFYERLSRCWADHDRDRDAVEAEIESLAHEVPDAAAAGRLVALANHVLGQEGGEWSKAAAIADTAIKRCPPVPSLGPALAGLAVARHMSGDNAGALVAETRAAALTGREGLAEVARARLLLVEALVGEEFWDEALPLLSALLDLAETGGVHESTQRVMAVTCNNVASQLVEHEARTPDMDALLERAALASREAWLRCGDWVNDERSDYLLALAYNALGRPAEARDSATRGLATIAANGTEDVDAAFLHVARGRALLALGEGPAAGDDLAAAEKLGSTFDEEEWRAKLQSEIDSLRA